MYLTAEMRKSAHLLDTICSLPSGGPSVHPQQNATPRVTLCSDYSARNQVFRDTLLSVPGDDDQVPRQFIAEPNRPFFIAWTYPGDRPDAIQYEITPFSGGSPVVIDADIDEAISVERAGTVRFRARWGTTFGRWNDDPWGVPWKEQ